MTVRRAGWLVLALAVVMVPAVGAQAPAANLAAVRQAAEAGDPRAHFLLGISYRDGRGVAVDLPMAYYWISLAAAFAETEVDQGTYYDALDALTTRMTPAQKTEGNRRGFDETGRLATAGRAWAQAFLGAALHGGTTVDGTKDMALGIQWLKKAAAQGDSRAQFKLGRIHYDGEGVPVDFTRAMEFFGAAARQGHVIAQAALANGYRRGIGVLQDYVEAHKWLNLAAARATGADQKGFASSRDQLAQSMTPAQIAEAQQRARDWLDAFERPVGKVVGGLPPAPPPPPPPPATEPVRAGGAIKDPVRTKYVEPVYPPVAISARVQGLVFIEAVIGPDGRITKTTITRSASPLLDLPALEAVRQWQYTPTILNGVPVSVIMTVVVTFALK